MIHFFLNIEKFYLSELENGFEVQAVACIEYPIIHLIARTVETMEEEFDELDKFIIQTASLHHGFSIKRFSEVTGLSESVFVYRAEELLKQEYISYEKETIKPIEKGIEFLKDPNFKREIEKTRSFILDGVTHRPLRSYFYKEGKGNLISEEERDSYGKKIFSPSIIHNPPKKNLTQLILRIPMEERALYSIPSHLKTIKDYDFVLMTYPLPIALSKTNNGITYKKIVDGFTRLANDVDISIWQNELKEEISKIEIVIEEKGFEKEGTKVNKIQFKNNWGNTKPAVNNRIYNITKDKLKPFILKLYRLSTIDDKNIIQNDQEIIILFDRHVYKSENSDKQKILEACVRGRDYYVQYEGLGVWLVFFKVHIVDDYMLSLSDLFKSLKDEITVIELLKCYNYDYKSLRQKIVALERYDKLEELDIYLYTHLRETNFNQNYLTI